MENMRFIQLLHKLSRKKKIFKISWIGLDFSGKTTLVKRISRGIFEDNLNHTLGLDIDEFKFGNAKFICWDVGGQRYYRDSLWEPYINGSYGIIFVIDSNDEKRFEEARVELWKWVIDTRKFDNIPLLILANKDGLRKDYFLFHED